jgi:hypothetical protein
MKKSLLGWTRQALAHAAAAATQLQNVKVDP